MNPAIAIKSKRCLHCMHADREGGPCLARSKSSNNNKS